MKTVFTNSGNEIIFYTPEHVENFYNPRPSNKFIPTWFKKLSQTLDPDNKNKSSLFLKNGQPTPDGTVKKCIPFLDAYNLGYIIPIPYDLIINKSEKGCQFFSGVKSSLGEEFIGAHTLEQIQGSPITGNSNCNKIFKVNSPWRIKTPKGYSCIFTAPFNRPELPLQVLTGIVDTDTYHSVNFSFNINLEIGEHLIEANTPLVQVIPFKRESWISKKLPFNKNDLEKEHTQVLGFLNNFYKRKHHKKKTFL